MKFRFIFNASAKRPLTQFQHSLLETSESLPENHPSIPSLESSCRFGLLFYPMLTHRFHCLRQMSPCRANKFQEAVYQQQPDAIPTPLSHWRRDPAGTAGGAAADLRPGSPARHPYLQPPDQPHHAGVGAGPGSTRMSKSPSRRWVIAGSLLVVVLILIAVFPWFTLAIPQFLYSL